MKMAIEKLRSEHLGAVFRLLEMANMHHISAAEMPGLTLENYHVALVDGRVVDFCGFKIPPETEAETELMVVDPAFRGHEIGLRLQIRCMEVMREKGIRVLMTSADLPQTTEWYKKHFGYREIGKLKKPREFGCPDVDHGTMLRAELR